MTTQTQIQPPENLDLTVLHTPAEVDAWRGAWADYHAATRAQEHQAQQKEAAASAHANRVLTRDEYYQRAVQEEAEKQAKEAEREAARQAKEAEKQAYLDSQPETVEILANDAHTFLMEFQLRIQQGYQLADDGIKYFAPHFCHVELHKPASGTRKTR